MSFQQDAFQDDAFQISNIISSDVPVPLTNVSASVSLETLITPTGVSDIVRHLAYLSQADLDNPAIVIDIIIDEKIAEGVYARCCKMGFRGGPNQGKGGKVTPLPGLNMLRSEVEGKTHKVTATKLGNNVNVGLIVDTE